MESGIYTVKDVIEIFALSVGSITLILAVIGYLVTKRHLNFSVIFSCNERFQKIRVGLNSDINGTQHKKEYIDLCNEEIFYFQNKYIPKIIMREWLDGMIFYIPHFTENQGGGKKFSDNAKFKDTEYLNKEFGEYPRLDNTFRVKKLYDINNSQQRKDLIKELINNIRKNA